MNIANNKQFPSANQLEALYFEYMSCEKAQENGIIERDMPNDQQEKESTSSQMQFVLPVIEMPIQISIPTFTPPVLVPGLAW